MVRYGRKFIFVLTILVLVVLTMGNGSAADVPAIEWQKVLGGDAYEEGSSIQQTDDGGYILTGWTNSQNSGDVGARDDDDYWAYSEDVWVVKLNSAGTIQWQKVLGGNKSDVGNSIQQTSDKGYILTGYTSSNSSGDVGPNHGKTDVWVVKLDAAGTLQWQKVLGGSGDEAGNSIRQTSDGGYILTGKTYSSNTGDVGENHDKYNQSTDVWVVKLDSAGIIQWQKVLGTTCNDEGSSIQQTADEGYVLTGSAMSCGLPAHGGKDVWVVKLDSEGAIEWQKVLGGNGDEAGSSIQQTSDNGYILTGYTSSNSSGDVGPNHSSVYYFTDVWVVKLNSAGSIQWQKVLGGSFSEWGYSIWQTCDGGYVLTGASSSSNSGDVGWNHDNNGYKVDIWVVRLDPSGTILWQKMLGGTWDEVGYSIQQADDGGYILAGYTLSSNTGDVGPRHAWYGYDYPDVWVVKLLPDEVLPAEPTISLESPDGGESWQQGSVQAIQWTYTGDPGSDVKIELYENGLFSTVITGSTSIGSSGSGSYSWTIPSVQDAGCDYQIKITSISNPVVSDLSDNAFTLTTGYPDMEISDLSIEAYPDNSGTLDAGGQAKYKFKISNRGNSAIPKGEYHVNLKFYDDLHIYSDNPDLIARSVIDHATRWLVDEHDMVFSINSINPGGSTEVEFIDKLDSDNFLGLTHYPFYFVNSVNLFVDPANIGDPDFNNNYISKNDMYVLFTSDFHGACVGLIASFFLPSQITDNLNIIAPTTAVNPGTLLLYQEYSKWVITNADIFENPDPDPNKALMKVIDYCMMQLVYTGKLLYKIGYTNNAIAFSISQLKTIIFGAKDCADVGLMIESFYTAWRNVGCPVANNPFPPLLEEICNPPLLIILEEISGGTDIIIQDDLNNRVGYEQGTTFEDITGSAVFIQNGRKYFIFPNDRNYQVTIRDTGTGHLGLLQLYPGDNGVSKYLFFDIPVQGNSIITTQYHIGDYNYSFNNDYDGNGVIDFIVEPTIFDTPPPRLYDSEIIPKNGDINTEFGFRVKYVGINNPDFVNLVIDGGDYYPLSLETCSTDDCVNEGFYSTRIIGEKIGIGTHSYHFETNDGNLSAIGDIYEHADLEITHPKPIIPLPGYTNPPTDPDHDGIYEDLNGNSRLDFADLVLYFNQMTWIAANEPVSAFDFNGNGRIDFADIVALFNEV